MLSTARALAIAMLALACDGPSSKPVEQSPPAPPPNEAAWSAEPVAAAPTNAAQSGPRPAVAYDRKTWKHWTDDDHDCQDTRTEVLITEAYADLELEGKRECEVAAGQWQCPYTGEIIREAHLLDVDHLVPLANAHRSGGFAWNAERRQRYANDLGYPNHLIAVDYGANRSKGDKGPEAWLPPSEEFRCTYVREWKAIKAKWQLGMTQAETTAVAAALEACEAGRIPSLPEARPKPTKVETPHEPASKKTSTEAEECCKVCKKGKACGDGCIARESTCTKPPGCACDG